MISVDSNVLIAAHRNEHNLHAIAYDRLIEIAEGDAPWGLPVFCIPEFLRVVTHARVFSPPTSLPLALAFIDRLLDSPSIRLLVPSDGFWSSLRAVTEDSDARGNLVFDAQIAAVCQEHGAIDLITADRDFSRFPQIRPEFL